MSLLITFTLLVIGYYIKKYELRASDFDLFEIKNGYKYRIGLKDRYTAEYYSCTPFSIKFKIIYQNTTNEIIINHLSDIYGAKVVIKDDFIKVHK